MSVLIWTTLLLCGIAAGATARQMGAKVQCDKDFKVTLSEVNIAAEAGLCVVIPCSFNTTSDSTQFVWQKCNNPPKNCEDRKVIFRSKTKAGDVSEFKGRVWMLEPDLEKRNCSIVITGLNFSDSPYKFGVTDLKKGCKDPQTVTVSVQALSQKPTVTVPPLIEGQETNLTCTAPGLCPGPGPEITWTWRGPGHEDSHIPGNITPKTEKLTDNAQRHSSTLTFNPTAEHNGTEVTCKVSFKKGITTEETVTLNVTSGEEVKNVSAGEEVKNVSAVEEVKTVNMTCSLKLGLKNTLHVPHVAKKYSGKYVCKVGRVNQTSTEEVNITVTSLPENSNSSECVVKSGVVTCGCDIEAFDLPNTTRSLPNSVTFNTSNHTISFTVSVKNDSNNVSVECVSSSDEAKQNPERHSDFILDNLLAFLTPFLKPHAIIAFFIGILFSAVIFCLVSKCCRNKRKSSGIVANGLEMVSTQAFPLVDAVVENDGVTEQAEGSAIFGGQAAACSEPKDVEYSDIDFFLMKRKSPTGAEQTQETEYAEINKKDKDGEGGGMGGGEQEEVMMGEEEVMVGGEEEVMFGEEEAIVMMGKEEEGMVGEEEERMMTIGEEEEFM